MEYCCHVWAGAPNSYFDKLHKWVYWAIGPSLAALLESLAHCQNVTNLCRFCRYYFEEHSSELAEFACFLVVKISVSTVSFLIQLDSGIL